MDLVRYRVQREGDRYVVYRETVYDSGHKSTPVSIDHFSERYLAEKFIEEINKREAQGD